MKDKLCHVKWPCGVVNVIQAWLIAKIYDVSVKAVILGKRCENNICFPLSSCASPILILTLHSVSPGLGGKDSVYRTQTLQNRTKNTR